MKISLRIGLAAVALTFIFSFFCVTETKAQMVTEILNRMDTHYKALKTLRADVKMVKFDGALMVTEASDIYEGKVTYLPAKNRDALIRIDWSKPSVESLSVVNKQYVIYRPRLNQALVGNVNKTEGSAGVNSPLAFMNMSKAELKANYNIKYLGEEKVNGTISTWHLELTPKKAAEYKTSEIWVDGNGMPVQFKTVAKNKDSTTVVLTNLEKNASIEQAVFKIILPKDIKIIKK